jgi:outer membrane protein TolC
VRERPAQARALMPPTLEAQIWQWPVTTVNPLNTNMYMFTFQQELPGRGKRDLRVALANTDAEIASTEIAVRARGVLKDVMTAYANLVVARRAIDIHLQSVELLRQFADASTIKVRGGPELAAGCAQGHHRDVEASRGSRDARGDRGDSSRTAEHTPRSRSRRTNRRARRAA